MRVDSQREGPRWTVELGGQRGWLVTEGCVHSDLQSLLLIHPLDIGGESELELQALVYCLNEVVSMLNAQQNMPRFLDHTFRASGVNLGVPALLSYSTLMQKMPRRKINPQTGNGSDVE